MAGVALWCLAVVMATASAQDTQPENEGRDASTPHLEASQSFFNGSASYRIAVDVPKGTGGMTPALSLSYASQAKWSELGYGWSLSGLDTIRRSTKCGVPEYGADDTFVWRGQDLVADASGVYHTQKESFTRIESVGTGPTRHWIATLPSGVKYFYGRSEGGRVMSFERADEVRLWALDRVQDTNGNYYTVSYTHDDTSAAYYPDTITYTMNDRGRLTAYRTVTFLWESRPDVRTTYADGTRVTIGRRLASIDARVDGALLRRYRIDYEEGSGGKSLLSAVTVVGTDGTELPSTRFRYSSQQSARAPVVGGPAQDVFADVVEYGDGLGTSLTDTDGRGATKMLTDINGDGKPDEVQRLRRPRRGVAPEYQVRLNAGSGFDEPIGFGDGMTDGVTETVSGKRWSVSVKALMDINGDGRPDEVRRAPVGRTPGNYQVRLNTGTGFGPELDWGPGEGQYLSDAHSHAKLKLLRDMNGDGLPDEVYRRYRQRMSGPGGRGAGARPEQIHDLQVRLNTGRAWRQQRLGGGGR